MGYGVLILVLMEVGLEDGVGGFIATPVLS